MCSVLTTVVFSERLAPFAVLDGKGHFLAPKCGRESAVGDVAAPDDRFVVVQAEVREAAFPGLPLCLLGQN
jgi:hypothetical protein